ncbi:hypothetical protein HPB48_011215 [Haemaphysalis longicornis]|uniref:Uncharacterized protein n=1 Tax=Haemaphysalis longicornis TaxID=44386 RepID=A0A9J6FM37_HAELO|nr:hypothetical protein HPB48_011215 [Haemaphysalis longicornis]
MRRIDAHLFESVTQALQVVGQSRDHASLEPLLIILPFLLSVALTRFCPLGRRASLSTASSRSRTSCCGSFSFHHLQEARVARSDSDYAIRTRGRRTLRSYGVDQRPGMVDIPSVEFPALKAEQRFEAVSPASAADATRRELVAVVTIQYWFRNVFRPKFHAKPQRSLQDAHWETVDIDDSLHSEAVNIDNCAEAAGDQGESSSSGTWCSDDDENDINGISTPVTLTDAGPGTVDGNHLSYGCSVIRGNTEVISEDFATALHEAAENVCQGDSDAYLSAGPAVSATKALHADSEYEPSDVDNSALSEETTYITLPQPNPSAVALIQHFAELHRVDPDATFPSTPPPPPSARKVFGELLDFCGQEDAITFTTLLQELGVDGCLKLRETRQSEIFRVCGVRGVAVLKVVHCGYIVRHLPCLLNEVVVGTVDGMNHRIHFSGERELFQPYAVLYMSFAGLPLPKVKFENALQLRSVVQQVALTLAAAEVVLEFEHRALTLHHVLVKEAEERVDEFRLLSSSVYVNLHGIMASIVDFAASRMRADIGMHPLCSFHMVSDV